MPKYARKRAAAEKTVTTASDKTRIVLVVTEASPVDRLWAAAEEAIRGTEAEVLVLLLSDDRWVRAASLPFTQEISRIGAKVSAFTHQRARQIASEATARTQTTLQELAGRAKVSCSFRALSESEPDHIREFVAASSLFVAPSTIRTLSVFASLEQSGCRMVLVDP